MKKLTTTSKCLLVLGFALVTSLSGYKYGFHEGYKAREVDQIKETIDQILSKACADPENQHQLYCHAKSE